MSGGLESGSCVCSPAIWEIEFNMIDYDSADVISSLQIYDAHYKTA